MCGKAVALEPEAELPFPDILAYHYQVFDEVYRVKKSQGIEKRRYRDLRYEGFYLVPTGIENDAGVVRLGGFPDLIHTEKSALPQGVLSRAEEKAQLKPRVLPSLVARAIMLAHTQDRIDVDIKYHEEELAARGTCKSRVLHPGDQVCVFGKWNDGELLPAASRARGLPVYAGTAKDVFDRLKDDSTAFMVLGAVALVIAAGVAL